jgi:signal transduction histidine kinase/ligand-binding sensor domain-containing protein
MTYNTAVSPVLHSTSGRVVSSCRTLQLLLLLLLSLFAAGTLPAQLPSDTSQVEFGHISFADGLVNSSVSAITQDDYGFLWFATQGGLQRYDGYQMRLYTAEPFESNSLSHQLVQTVFLAPDNVMWVGTYAGLNRFDMTTGAIRHFPHQADDLSTLSGNVVTSIALDADERLWVATLDGLSRLDDEARGMFTRFVSGSGGEDGLPHDTVRAVFLDSRETLWIGSFGGLSRVRTEGEDVRFHTTRTEEETGEDREFSLPSPYVMTITEDDQGMLWVGTWGGGVSRLDTETGRFTHYELSDNRVYTVMAGRAGLIYAATWGGGLHVIDPDTGTIVEHRHNPDVERSLAHDVVYSLHEDRSGIIWIGTNGNGISKYDRSRESFRFIHRELPEKRRLDAGKVQVLWAHPSTRELYVGLQNSGLNVVDPDSGEITRYRHDPEDPATISSDTVNGILPESDGTILVSTHAGINRFIPPSRPDGRGRFERLDMLDDQIVYRMIRDRAGRTWIGSYSFGLYRFDPDGTRYHYPHDPDDPRSLTDNLVYDILEDSHGVLWIATNGGLNRYLPGSDDFDRFTYDRENPQGLSANSTSNLYEDHRGTLWVGTRAGGLNRFHRDTGTFSHIFARDGLSSNTVTAIREGDPGRLYVATPNGLNLVLDDGDEILQIDERDGLYAREFSTGVTRDHEGRLLFGAFSEIIRVASRAPETGGVAPVTVITEISVMNEPLELPFRHDSYPELHLTHEENFLSFSFSALSFANPERNRYRYRLVGIDNDWIEAGTHRAAVYTNLPPGQFQFQVIGSDARGLESEEPATISVVIRPPFWLTGWFLVLTGFLVVISIVVIYLLRVRSLQRLNRQLETIVAERTARLTEANEVKDQFFSIIAHDLRGPIAGLESLTGRAVEESPSYDAALLREVFSTIHATARGLSGMLENLLEWARVQSGRIVCAVQAVPVDGVLRDALDTNSGSIRSKEITARIACDTTTSALADPRMLQVIVENILNNALKFTPRGGTVTLECKSDEAAGTERTVRIVVRDTGVGIPPEKIPGLFRVGERHRSAGTDGERGSGFGLALCSDLARLQGGRIEITSEVGHGTTVTVTLPAAPEAPAAREAPAAPPC